MTITKSDLVDRLHRRAGLTRREAQALVESLLELMKDCLARGEGLLLSGFGHFRIVEKRPRPGRNPYSGVKITIRGRRLVSFKPSRVLKGSMNED